MRQAEKTTASRNRQVEPLMPPRPIIIDCDPGLDDAVAIALAAASPSLRIEAVTTVAGNAGIEMVTRNALGIAAALGGGIPVHRGSGRPLVKPLRTSADLWGGTGDLGLAKRVKPEGAHGVVRIIDFLEAARKPSRVVAIGPLTNIAAVIVMRPDLAGKIGELAVMGGGLDHGNATPHAELNIWVDPHAAHTVFASGIRIVLAPLDITEPLKVPPALTARLAGSAAPAAKLVARLLPLGGAESHAASIHDAATIAFLLWPDLFEARPGTVTVEIADGRRQGETRFREAKSGPHRVLTAIDQDAFLGRLAELLCGVR
jgi:purine nucleosidase